MTLLARCDVRDPHSPGRLPARFLGPAVIAGGSGHAAVAGRVLVRRNGGGAGSLARGTLRRLHRGNHRRVDLHPWIAPTVALALFLVLLAIHTFA